MTKITKNIKTKLKINKNDKRKKIKLVLIICSFVFHMLVKDDHGSQVAMVNKGRDGGHLALLISLPWTPEGDLMLLGSGTSEGSLMGLLLDRCSKMNLGLNPQMLVASIVWWWKIS